MQVATVQLVKIAFAELASQEIKFCFHDDPQYQSALVRLQLAAEGGRH